jgi:gliding motility-associated-like protein
MRLFTFSILLLFSAQLQAQQCLPGMSPQTATSVCGTLTFPQANVPSCQGPNLPGSGPIGCTDPITSSNSVFYRFHCYQTGPLGFLISPASGTDDYDWALMDITGRQPQDIYTMNLMISINLSGVTGITGCTAAGLSDANCAGGANGTQFNRMPTLTAGNDYLLMVTNWNNSGLGYQLVFNGGTAVLTDNQLPTISNVGANGCNTSQIRLQFSEDILCSSLTAAGTEFSITDGTSTYPFSSITSLCTTGLNAVNNLTLNMQNPLPPGNYNLVVNTGTDANSLLDVCLTEMIPGSSFPFTIAAQPPIAVNDISYTGCAPTTLKVALNKPVLCSSITATGSEFSITPGNPSIASVQTVCGGTTAYTDTIIVVLQDPLPHGNYQLVVNNGTDANTLIDTCNLPLAAGYQFPFTITQITTPPVMQSIAFDECKPFRVVVNFDKPVSCAGISASGSEFSVTPGGLTVTGISNICSGGTTSQVVLTLSGNLPAGNFNVNINAGSDGNTLSDSCFAFMPAGSTSAFSTTQAPAPVYDSLQYDECSPSSVKIFYSHPILCSSINPNGSEFSITGPVPVSIASVNTDVTCTSGYTNWVIVNLSQPINTLGTFVLHNAAGTDGNSVADTCFASQNINETISFNVLGKPSAAFEDSVHFGCVMDTLVVSHPGGNGINSWQWTFSDGTVLTGQSVFHMFPVSTVTASVQLVVSNGVCNDTLSRSYTLDNAFATGFTISADTLCRNSDLSFTNTSTGNNLTYTWNFGDGNSFAGQTPPPHAYLNPGNYNVILTATNDHFCVDDSIKTVNVADTPTVLFTGLNTQYCTAETLTLANNINGVNVTSYTWNNGNGVTTANQSPVNFTYSTQGNYNIVLTATDRFCGDFSFAQSTQIYQVPVFSLGEDLTFCPGGTTQIGVDATTGYTYLWNTGAATPKITSTPVTATYTLTIDNNTCNASDEISIEVLDNCLIKVPGAFTPNGDGLNDRLKAINADLATAFQFRVYNRFGQLIFSTRIPTDGWDGLYKGQRAEAGTYVWQLSYVHPVTGLPVFEKGTSILIR